MAGIEPAASTLARRDRSLAVTPAGRLPRSRFGLPLWCSRYGGVKNQACRRGSQGRQELNPHFAGFGDSLAHPQVNENRPGGLSLGRLPASASWRLHGNHSADQGSLKLRDRVHVPGSFRRLQCRHTSMVGRLPAQGNCIYRRMVNPGSGRHRTPPGPPPPAARRPPPAAAARRRRPPPGVAAWSPGVAEGGGCGSLHPRVCTLPQPRPAARSLARTDLSPGARSKRARSERRNRPLPGKDRTIQHATGTGIPRSMPGNLWMVCA